MRVGFWLMQRYPGMVTLNAVLLNRDSLLKEEPSKTIRFLETRVRFEFCVKYTNNFLANNAKEFVLMISHELCFVGLVVLILHI